MTAVSSPCHTIAEIFLVMTHQCASHGLSKNRVMIPQKFSPSHAESKAGAEDVASYTLGACKRRVPILFNEPKLMSLDISVETLLAQFFTAEIRNVGGAHHAIGSRNERAMLSA